MLLPDALDAMDAALGVVGAPRRQRDAVRFWRSYTAGAAQRAGVFTKPRGVRISAKVHSFRGWVPNPELGFINGDHTHRAWVVMSRAVVACLDLQHSHAAVLRQQFTAMALSALAADEPEMAAAATNMATAARLWQSAAAGAASYGRALIAREDRIHQPIGHAIAAAGGIHQVAQAKDYHQAGA